MLLELAVLLLYRRLTGRGLKPLDVGLAASAWALPPPCAAGRSHRRLLGPRFSLLAWRGTARAPGRSPAANAVCLRRIGASSPNLTGSLARLSSRGCETRGGELPMKVADILQSQRPRREDGSAGRHRARVVRATARGAHRRHDRERRRRLDRRHHFRARSGLRPGRAWQQTAARDGRTIDDQGWSSSAPPRILSPK